MKHLLFIFDRFMQIFSLDLNNEIISKLHIDLPQNVINDGSLKDKSHFKYLLTKYFNDNGYKKENLTICLNSTSIITRGVRPVKSGVYSLEDQRKFLEDDCKNNGVNLKEFTPFQYSLIDSSMNNKYIYSLVPNQCYKSFENVFGEFRKNSVSILPSDILLLDYISQEDIGELWKLDDQIFSVYNYSAEEIRVLHSRAESMSNLFKKYNFEYSEIPDILEKNYDERTTNIPFENFMEDFYFSLDTDINHINRLSDFGGSNGNIYLLNPRSNGKVIDYYNHVLTRKNILKEIDFEVLASHFFKNEDNFIYSHNKNKKSAINLIYVFLLLGIVIMVCSYLLGEKIDLKNDALTNKNISSSILEKDESKDSSTHSNKPEDLKTEDSEKISDTFTLIQALKPEGIVLSRLYFENDTYEINGQVENIEDLDMWLNKLEKEGFSVSKDPFTSIDGIQYFKFSIKKGSNDEK